MSPLFDISESPKSFFWIGYFRDPNGTGSLIDMSSSGLGTAEKKKFEFINNLSLNSNNENFFF